MKTILFTMLLLATLQSNEQSVVSTYTEIKFNYDVLVNKTMFKTRLYDSAVSRFYRTGAEKCYFIEYSMPPLPWFKVKYKDGQNVWLRQNMPDTLIGNYLVEFYLWYFTRVANIKP